MKNSSKFLLIVLGVIAALLIVLTVTVRVMISDHIVVRGDGDGFSFDSDAAMMTEEYDLSDFSRIRITGAWDVELTASEDYAVSVDFSEEVQKYISVESRNGILYLDISGSKKGNLNDFHGATARISMPVLESVRVDGAVNMNLADFEGDAVEFRLDGAGQIIAGSCSFDSLKLESNGAVNIDFDGSSVRSAEVDIDGAGNLELHMSGGELSGQISGFANLQYSGDVSRMTVAKDGLANIEYVE